MMGPPLYFSPEILFVVVVHGLIFTHAYFDADQNVNSTLGGLTYKCLSSIRLGPVLRDEIHFHLLRWRIPIHSRIVVWPLMVVVAVLFVSIAVIKYDLAGLLVGSLLPKLYSDLLTLDRWIL